MSEISLQTSLLHRVSPVPLKQMNVLSSERLSVFLDHLQQTEQDFEEHCEKFTDLLFEKIQLCQNPKDRNKLLNGKRAIHNRKQLKPQEEQIIQTHLNKKEQEWLENYKQYLTSISSELEKGEILFKEALETTRKNFQSLIRENESFIQSLQLSSQSLFSQLNGYLNTNTSALKKTQIQAETALLKYLTRQYTKTSPFSRFTCLSLGESTKKNDTIQAKVRLNNYLLPYLKGLLLQVPEIARNIPIRRNPTIESKKTSYSYLVNFNNVEVFQQINRSGGLDYMLSCADGNVTIARLSQQLTAEFEATEPSAIEAYLFQLMDIGFIEPNINVSGTDPEWSAKFLDFLRQIGTENPDSKSLQHGLEHLQEATTHFGNTDTSTRQRILDEALEVFKEAVYTFCTRYDLPFSEGEANKEVKKQFLDKVNQDTSFRIRYFNGFYFTKETIFYEDAAISEASPYTVRDLQPLTRKLDNLYQILLALSPSKEQNKAQQHFFKTYYPGKNTIPLMRFYEDYSREFLKPHKQEKEHLMASFLQEKSEKQEQQEQLFKNRFMELLKHKAGPHEQLNFTEEELSNVFVVGQKQASRYTKGTHIQLYHSKNNEICGVVNSVFNGYGRGYGRFLHLFPETIADEIRNQNRDFFGDSIMAEIKDASCFNANIHPPLLPHEILIPGGNTNLPEDQQLPVRDLVVQCDNHSIYLLHEPTGKKVLPFDLCLQTTKTRSELYQLLVSFSPSAPFAVFPLQNWLYEYIEANQKNEVIVFPRIVFEEQLTLFRKCWKVPCAVLPEDLSTVSDFDYSHQLKAWRNKYDIPRNCFVFITPTHKMAGKNATFDDYKPQFIDFESPLLIRLFRKAIRKADQFIRIEEMLPGKEAVADGAVTETLIQWSGSTEE